METVYQEQNLQDSERERIESDAVDKASVLTPAPMLFEKKTVLLNKAG